MADFFPDMMIKHPNMMISKIHLHPFSPPRQHPSAFPFTYSSITKPSLLLLAFFSHVGRFSGIHGNVAASKIHQILKNHLDFCIVVRYN